MSTIQEQFEKDNTDYFKLNPGEYEGPLVINRKCVIDGQNSTLWANKGPVLSIESEKVIIKNLRVEITTKTNDTEQPILIKTNYKDTILNYVEVNGNIDGFSESEKKWSLPSMIQLGKFAADKNNIYIYQIDAADNAEIINKIKDIEIEPKQIVVGTNKIVIKTNPLRNNTILYGEILIKSKVTRRIYISGKADINATVHNDSSVIIQNHGIDNFPQTEMPQNIIAPVVSENNIEYLKRGQRISINKYCDTLMKIVYEHRGTQKALDVDSYIFLLLDNEKVSTDNDLIFFGNKTSNNGEVTVTTSENKQIAIVDLQKTEQRVNKISVCYSIYDDNFNLNFSMVDRPLIRVFFAEKEIFRYVLSDIDENKTVVGLEIYRYKNEWKIGVVGAGFKNGLKQLCENYGVNVD